jgi:cytochrome b
MTTNPEHHVVWDWTVRLVHWLMVILVLLLWWTAEEGMMDWHKRCGLTMLGLVIFRIIWGFAGSWTARFVPMFRRLGSLGSYVRDLKNGSHKPVFGHGPLGILSVFALLGALSVQVGTGLFSVDVDGLESGPLAIWVSFSTGRDIADIHELNFDILSTLISLHVAAILVYQFILKDNLIPPMVTGKRPVSDFAASTVPTITAGFWAFVLSAGIASGSVYAVLHAG